MFLLRLVLISLLQIRFFRAREGKMTVTGKLGVRENTQMRLSIVSCNAPAAVEINKPYEPVSSGTCPRNYGERDDPFRGV